ncbi:MAG: hypothetical protein M3Z20_12320 [Chloroflexota bacterium]|nr:hypothetical protein [Chloroflexota bacterium]
MAGPRFDTLTRALSWAIDRRSLGAFAALGLSGLVIPEAVEARKKKPCPPCRKRKHGTCKKKLTDGTACAGGTCQGGPCGPPTCTDGARNGSESDVDCGGSCPRCANGKRCGSRDDCASAVCTGGICAPCLSSNNCVNALCSCGPTVSGGDVCFTVQAPVLVASCNLCPAGTDCVLFLGGLHCIALCRAA